MAESSLPPNTPVQSAAQRSPWPAALQNLGAIFAVTLLAETNILSGNVAAGMILGILGVIAIPALKSSRHTGSVGVFALMGSKVLLPLLHLPFPKLWM